MKSTVDLTDFDIMQMILVHSYFHFHTHSYNPNYLLQTQPGKAKRGPKIGTSEVCLTRSGVIAAMLHVPVTDCSGELVLMDSGEAVLE